MIHAKILGETVEATDRINTFLDFTLFSSFKIKKELIENKEIFRIYAKTADTHPTYIVISFPTTEKDFSNPIEFVDTALWNNPSTKENEKYDKGTKKSPETNDEIVYLTKLIFKFIAENKL